MVISEVAKEIELTADTLRYYEKEGLIGPIAKEKSGIRNYTEEDLQRIKFVKCMREAGMEVKYLKRYIQLLDKGDETIQERRNILLEQRKIIERKLNATKEAYDRINYKIELYDKKMLDNKKHIAK